MVDTIITGDLGVNTYLYNFKENKISIIDPGADADKIISYIESRNYYPVNIILTHGHFDHIGAVSDLKAKYNIPVLIHDDDSGFLGPDSKIRHIDMFKPMGPQGNFYVDTYFKPTDSPETILHDKQIIEGTDLEVIHTPGHSPGSICLYSKSKKIIFTGDTLFKNGLGRTDFGGGDYRTLLKSLNKLFTLPEETVVYPGHGEATKLESEKGITQLY